MTGPSEVWVISPWDSYTAWGKSMARDEANAELSAELERLSAADADAAVHRLWDAKKMASLNAAMDTIPPSIWFLAKTTSVIFIIMWFRWTFPRLRVDQLMHLEWKVLLPLGFANLFVAAVVVLTELYPFPLGK